MDEAETYFKGDGSVLERYFDAIQNVRDLFETATQSVDDAIDQTDDVYDFDLSDLLDPREYERALEAVQDKLDEAKQALDDASGFLDDLKDLDLLMDPVFYLTEKELKDRHLTKMLTYSKHTQIFSVVSLHLHKAKTRVESAVKRLTLVCDPDATRAPDQGEHIEAIEEAKSKLEDVTQAVEEVIDALRDAQDL